MIDSLYGKYFQKSRSFLYPALGIKRTHPFSPSGTYISLLGKFGADDMKLVCTYKNDYSPEFHEFESTMLLGNPLFVEKISILDYNLYVFDFSIYQNDWFNFLMAKYSQLSTVLKKAIKSYYGENSTEYRYIETYLYPDKFYDVYGKLLGMDPKDLKKIGELCDPWDEDKETLKIPVENLESLKKES